MDVFWADQIATQAIERAKGEKEKVTCRTAGSTSGAKHIGNFYDIAKAYFVHKAVLKKKYRSRTVFTHDDRDPLRAVPERLPDLDGKWMKLDEGAKAKIAKYLGYPYVSIPDVFDCCESWAKHFACVLEDGMKSVGMNDIETYSTNELYLQDKFDEYITLSLEKIDISRRIIQKFQETKTKDFIPLDVICENCGRITATATSFDLGNHTVKYSCTAKELAGKYKVEGCGKSGEVIFRNTKLPWSFEWPAQWGIFTTTFEPFGKEHAEGSWPRCQEIARQIYGLEPPIPHIYEFLLINGEKMSARKGNAFIVQEMLEIIDPEVFLYFYTKRSKKQRNIDMKNIHALVDEFEKAEKIYFEASGEERIKTDNVNTIRMYESSMNTVPQSLPTRIPYQLAVMISSMYGPSQETKNIAMKLIGAKISEREMMDVDRRLVLANNWIDRVMPEMRVTVNEVPDTSRLDANHKKALKDLQSKLTPEMTEGNVNALLFDVAKKSGLGKEFFTACYQALISKESGPRLAPFIVVIGVDRVKKVLSQL